MEGVNVTNYTAKAVENITSQIAGHQTITHALVIPCLTCDFSTDSTKTDTIAPESVNINGGFIAMAAGLSVVVPLVCVLVMQLRRAKREERQRERRRREGGGGEDNAGTDLPPSYEQVFGQNYHSVAPPVHSRNSSMDALIEENETLRSLPAGSQPSGTYVAVRHPPGILGSQRELTNPAILAGARVNPGYSEAPLSTISGSHVADIVVSLLPSHACSTRVDILLSNGGGLDNADHHSSQVSAVLSDNHVPSSSSSQTPPPPPPPPPSPPRSPPPPFSSWSFRNPSTNGNNFGGISSSELQETLRRLPGMHISIEDFFASLRVLQDNENEGPPPSYDEALKILELAALAKEGMSIIT